MASHDDDHLDFGKLEKELQAAVAADAKYHRENDAKFRAVHQKVASYEEFRDIVLASHLKPLDKNETLQIQMTQPWNVEASKDKGGKPAAEANLAQNKEHLPSTSLEFAREWRRCKTSADRYGLLLALGATRAAKVFKVEISFGLLGEILAVLLEFKDDDLEAVCDLLEALTSAGRFDLSVTFLSDKEKETCVTLFKKLRDLATSRGSQDVVDKLTQAQAKYGC